RGGHGHHFDGAAGEAEGHGPYRAATSPVDDFVERGEEDSFVLQEILIPAGLFQSDAFCNFDGHTTILHRRGRLCNGRKRKIHRTLRLRSGRGGAECAEKNRRTAYENALVGSIGSGGQFWVGDGGASRNSEGGPKRIARYRYRRGFLQGERS